MYEISRPEPNSEEAILTRCGSKVRTLHKHFLTRFGGRGNKQTSYREQRYDFTYIEICLGETKEQGNVTKSEIGIS